MTLKDTRLDGLSSAMTASAAGISSSMLYVPGWIEAACGLAANASLNAFAVATTPASTNVAAMSAPVSPGLMTTSTAPCPTPV